MAWHVNQKVVCIKPPRGIKACPRLVGPKVGAVYTIREIFEGPDKWSGRTYFRLHEIVNPLSNTYLGPFEAAFQSIIFRPVKTTSTGLTILNRLLLPKPARKRARQGA